MSLLRPWIKKAKPSNRNGSAETPLLDNNVLSSMPIKTMEWLDEVGDTIEKVAEMEDDARSLKEDIEETIDALCEAKNYIELSIQYSNIVFKCATIIASSWGILLSLYALYNMRYMLGTSQTVGSLVSAYVLQKRKQATQLALRSSSSAIQKPLDKLQDQAKNSVRNKAKDIRANLITNLLGDISRNNPNTGNTIVGGIEFENPIPDVVWSVGGQGFDSMSTFLMTLITPLFLSSSATIVRAMKVSKFWKELVTFIGVIIIMALITYVVYLVYYRKVRELIIRRAERKILSYLNVDSILGSIDDRLLNSYGSQ